MPRDGGPALQLAAAVRELNVAEVRTLWNAATADGRLAVAALFTGLTLDQLAALEWEDVDIPAACLHLRGESRVHSLRPPLLRELQVRSSMAARTPAVASTVAGAALSSSDLAGLIAAAAHDADIDQPETIDAQTLRHTYISFLLRQGLRLSELEQLVGPVAPSLFLQYRNYLPRERRSAAEVDAVFPAFATA
jgi:integrase